MWRRRKRERAACRPQPPEEDDQGEEQQEVGGGKKEAGIIFYSHYVISPFPFALQGQAKESKNEVPLKLEPEKMLSRDPPISVIPVIFLKYAKSPFL